MYGEFSKSPKFYLPSWLPVCLPACCKTQVDGSISDSQGNDRGFTIQYFFHLFATMASSQRVINSCGMHHCLN